MSGPAVEFAVFILCVVALNVWLFWKTNGWEDLLRRITRRCEIHDRPAPLRIRQLEAELGMGPPMSSRAIARAGYANPALIDCGHDWCRARSIDL